MDDQVKNNLPVVYEAAAAATPSDSLDFFDPRHIFQMILRRGRAALLGFVVVFVAVLAFGLSEKPKYTAATSILISPRSSDIVKAGANGNDDVALPADSNEVDTQVELLGSPALAERVATKLDLYADPEFIKTPVNPAIPGPEAAKSLTSEQRARVATAVKSGLIVRRTGQTSVLSVAYTAGNPEKAALLANTFAQEFIEWQLEQKYNSNENTNTFLTQHLEELRRQAEASDSAVEQYKISHNLLSAQGSTMAEQEVSSLNEQIAAAQADRAEKAARLRAAESQIARGGGGEDIGAALGSDTIRQLRVEEATDTQRIAELSSRYGPMHPDVVKANDQLKDVQQQIQHEINRIVSSLQADVDVSTQRLNSLRASQDSARGSLAGSSRAETGLSELQRKADADRSLYEAVLNRSKETSIQGAAQPDARVISPAMPPLKPTSPKKGLVAAAAASLAFVTAILLILALEYLDAGMRTAEDVESQLGLPYAGSIPTPISSANNKSKDKKRLPPEEFLVKNPFSAYSEAFRSVRSFLVLPGPRGDIPKVVAITSALPQEGKSLSAFCLARTMANSGSKVVLVDGDLRRPGVTKLMSTATPHGVVELLQGRLTLEEVIVQDSATSACMIPAGVLGSERRDLFSTPAMDDLIAELSARFDYVLIDTPATLAVADARTIAAKADTVLFLVRWSKTPARAALTALNMLQETGANFAGVVLSRVDLRRQMLFSYGDRDYYFKDYRSYYTSAS